MCFRLLNRFYAAVWLAASLSISAPAFASKDVTLAVSVVLDTLDPHDSTSSMTLSVGKAYYEGLYEFDEHLKLQPKLALGASISRDGLVYYLKLRPNVRFHDGSKFDAQAVKVNLDRMSSAELKLARHWQFSRIKKTEVIDPYTVRVTLGEPYSAFLNVLANPGAMMISPKALAEYGGAINRHPVGTGPFKFVDFKPNEYLRVEKFDRYWAKGLPKIDTLTFRTVLDDVARVALIKSGEVQFEYPVKLEVIDELKQSENLEVVDNGPSIMARYVSMNVREKPFNDVKVRRAINYAIDKQALARVIYLGHANPATGVVPIGVQYSKRTGAWPFDPHQAKQLLAEAGYPNGFETTLWSAYDDPVSIRIVQFLQSALNEVGIKTTIDILDNAHRAARVTKVQKPEDAKVRLYYSTWSSGTGESDWALRPLFGSASAPPNANNTAYYSNDTVDAELAAALETRDDTERARLYADAQDIIWREAPWAFLVTSDILFVKNRRLSGVYVQPDTGLYFNDIDIN